MKYIRLILLFLVIFLSTGCVSYTELNELGIIDMILIDKIDNNYTVTINMITPSKDDLEEKKTYQASGKNLDKCLNELYLKTTKKIAFSHLELMALTTNIEKNDYDEIINLFLNRVDSRNSFSTVIIDNTKKLFEYKSKDINDLININGEESGIVFIKQFDEIVKDILEINISYIPYISIDDEITIKGYQSIYEENKLLSKEESIGYNFMTNNITQAMLISNNIGFKLNRSNTMIKVDENKIKIDINNNYQIVTNNSNITSNKDIERIYTKEIKKYIEAYINNNNHQYFYNLIRKFDYKYYKNNKDIELEFIINVNSSLIKNSNIKGGKI